MRMIKLSKHNFKIIAQVAFVDIMAVTALVSFIILGSCAANVIAGVLLGGQSSVSPGVALWLAYSGLIFPFSMTLAVLGINE